MKIAILDDYQDAARGLECFHLLDAHEVKTFTHSPRGLGQLAIRLAPFDALVLIRERTAFPAALLAKLPNLKLISQTGKVSGHIDVAAATAHGIAIAVLHFQRRFQQPIACKCAGCGGGHQYGDGDCLQHIRCFLRSGARSHSARNVPELWRSGWQAIQLREP